MGDANLVPLTSIPRLDASLLTLNLSSETLVHQTSAVTIRRSRLGEGDSAPVALLSFRSCYPKRQSLWEATLRLLKDQVFRQPMHPNLVSVIGLAHDASHKERGHDANAVPALVVMEMMPTSLYDVLHVDKLQLSRFDILVVATTVLDTLGYLHQSGQSFGSTLTSRKVMLGGSHGHVKLRHFCSEWIRREAETVTPISSACSFTSQYVMPTSEAPPPPASLLAHAQRGDLFAFGMLLLEMCTGDKPTPESCNSISQACQIDPRFARIIQATLQVGELPTHDMDSETPASLMSYCTKLLSECNRDDQISMASESARRSSRSFPSFLHADRYFLAYEARSVETQLATRMVQATVALKRLAAVEDDLVDEQKNFEVLVRQLEQLRLEKARDESYIKDLNHRLSQQRKELLDKSSVIVASHAEVERSHTQLAEAIQAKEEADVRLQQAHAQRMAVEAARQSLLVEVLCLKDAKRVSIDEKHDLARQLAETAAKVGGEKDAIEELDARYRQTIHRCEQEQKSRRAVERQLEALARQLTTMEDERARYCSALQMTPMGLLDARASQALVLELKEKEVHSLGLANQTLRSAVGELQSKLEGSERECLRLKEAVCPSLQNQIDFQQEEVNRISAIVSAVSSERDSLQLRIADANAFADGLLSTIASLEGQVGELQKQAADAEKARRLRQCLTPQCDAPRYLIKPSGFCVDCEEKTSKERGGKSRPSISSMSPTTRSPARGHRRQRSLDGASAILNTTLNAPLLELLQRMEVARDFDDETREQSSLDVIAILKQLGRVLKESVNLKEDLPECGVLKCVLSVMDQCRSSPVVVIECCKTLSVAIFNHDRNRLIVVAEGVVERVLQMLRAFPRDVEVQETGAVLLTNLSHNCESNRQRILAAGGVDAVLEMMTSFPRDAGIQKKACWALLTLAGSDFMCDKLAALGGVGATLAAMLNCPHDEDVQHYGCWTLLNLVSGTKHVQDFARREGVVEVVEAAVACFPDHVDIQEKCRDILGLIYEGEKR